MPNNRISETEARAQAAACGVAVSKIARTPDLERPGEFIRTVCVGAQTVAHMNRGGAACWDVNGKRVGYIGEAIERAINEQLASPRRGQE